jgi:predicted amidohydrolase
MSLLRIATCQFPVSSDIAANSHWICKQIAQAAKAKADIVHFSETALSGYAGVEFKSWKCFNWDQLKQETVKILDAARQNKIWVALGSSHRLSGEHLPHNSIYVIEPSGRIHDRYDKCFCTPDDLKYYSPGDHLVTFSFKGVKCGILICFDVRFPEIYRAYVKRGVQCMLHSFHNARRKGPAVQTYVMRQTLQGHAGINRMWISVPNSSQYYQLWPSVFIQPDGIIVASLNPHSPGVMVNTVDTRKKFYDPSGPFRKAAIAGILHNGKLVKDSRSRNRTGL